MQSGGERYGMGAAEIHAYVPAGSRGPSAAAGAAARGLSHLFGHSAAASGSGEMAGLRTLQLHRPSGNSYQQATAQQQYLEQLSTHQQQLALRGSAPGQHQGTIGNNHYLQHAGLQAHHSVASFFKAAAGGATGLPRHHNDPADTISSHSFFSVATNGQEQFKLLGYHSHHQLQLGNPTVEDEASAASDWRSDETAALLKLCSDVDLGSKVVPAVWDDVARKLQEMGYQRSPQICREKFESLNARSRSAKEDAQKRELEFSSDFSSEGGHADHVLEGGLATNLQTDENCDNNPDADEDDIIEEENHHVTERDYSNYNKNNINGNDNSRKRKADTTSFAPTKSFFESLAREIIEKQEELHRVFLDTIEKKERERVMREEAYRRHEAARFDREQELRAQEISLAASRDAALIAFLEKVTGHSFPKTLPKILGVPARVAPPVSSTLGPSSVANPATITAAYMQQQTSGDQGLLHQQALQDASDMDNNSDVNTKRWPKVEVHALIRLRSGMEPRFREAGPKAHLWQEISASMACLGFIRSPKRCKEKWENINKYFKKTKDSSKKRPENAKTCPYFHQLDTLYQRGILTSSSSGSGGKVIGKSDNLLEYGTQDDENGFNMQNADVMHTDKEASMGEIQNAGLQAQDKDIHSDHLDVDRYFHHHATGLNMNAAAKKSLQVEMFVKDILDLQQQQHQKLVEEYDRMEQAHELRELERQQIKQTPTSSVAHGSAHDSATFMALVHKLAGESSDLSISAPSTMDEKRIFD